MSKMYTKLCPGCNKEYVHPDNRQKFCSKSCYTKFHVGKNHHNFKTGIRIHSGGYLRNSKDQYIHRLVMEEHLGRKLRNDEHIHHVDGNVTNNDISNMVIMSNSEHRKLEYKLAPKNKYGQFIAK